MSNEHTSKRFGADALQEADGSWTARVVRTRSGKTSITRERAGFNNQQDAQKWATAQLLEVRTQIREGRAVRRAAAVARNAAVRNFSYRELAEHAAHAKDCNEKLVWKTDLLWQEVAFRMLKAGFSEQDAYKEANARVGRTRAERHSKALAGILDSVAFDVDQLAIASARLILQRGLGKDGEEIE